MINARMIAPCGLNCALCTRHLQKESPCPGCSGPDEQKPDCCRIRCRIVSCRIRRTLEDGFCDACEKYPCADVMEKELRYTSTYPMIETPLANLSFIRQNGMDAFLELEKERWSCPACRGVICVHDGVCASCAAEYTQRRPSRI